MRIRIKTGRTHQIRVHMKYLGCPVLGDCVYGKKDARFSDAALMLHAYKLAVRLPPRASDPAPIKPGCGSLKIACSQNTPAVFTAPVPDRFKKVLKVLHAEFSPEHLASVSSKN